MAICKIIPIGQSKGIGACFDYITNEEKVLAEDKQKPKPSLASILEDNGDSSYNNVTDIATVLRYMKNDEKTHRADGTQTKFISGYLCTPENAVQEFLNAKKQNLAKQNKTLQDETGNWAYHIIQSFPEGLEISDEEVHQCGRELAEKLGLYQAVICSHVHPVENDKSEITGKCKHNHILINSHIHPEKVDPTSPGVYKYHDCNETYAQLQKWNDEIALAHGLPIIRNPDMDRQSSWFKSKMENENASWTKQVARDIKKTMRFSSNWAQFKELMTEQGYVIRDTGKTITYYTPEHTETHKQQIREKRLGREYTRAELERYWANVGKVKEPSASSKTTPSQAKLIKALVKQYDTNLYATVTTTTEAANGKKKTYTLDVPIKNHRRERAEETLRTYFEADKTYSLSTDDHVPIAQVTGQDLFDYYEQLRREREQKKKKHDFYVDQEERYYEPTRVEYKTKKPYTVRLWDENGRRRTSIELICMLAVFIIRNEHAPTSSQPTFAYQGPDGKFIYAKTDWKLQNMYNTVALAREMEVEDASDVTRKLDRTGKEIARLRKQVRLLTEQYNAMDTINNNVETYQSVRGICEQIYQMPDGDEKDGALVAHARDLLDYKTAKRALHQKNINTDEQIADFQKRYQSTSAHLEELRQELDHYNQEYRNLKKIEYNLTLAQNDYYCYGPDHERFAEEQQPEKNDKDADNQK